MLARPFAVITVLRICDRDYSFREREHYLLKVIICNVSASVLCTFCFSDVHIVRQLKLFHKIYSMVSRTVRLKLYALALSNAIIRKLFWNSNN